MFKFKTLFSAARFNKMYRSQGEGTCKKGINVDQRRIKRGDEAVTLRKKKQQEVMGRKRRETVADEDLKLENLDGWLNELFSTEVSRQLEAAETIRRFLSLQNDPPISKISSRSDCVKQLVTFLDSDHVPLQFEASWALTNIASGTREDTQAVVGANAIQAFVRLLRTGDVAVAEQSIWALGNIAGDAVRYRDQILGLYAMTHITKIIVSDPPPRQSLLRNAVWTMSNLCRGKPTPVESHTEQVIPVVAQLLTHCSDECVLTDLCWSLSYLTEGSEKRIQRVVDHNIIGQLIKLLLLPSIVTPALRTLGNILTGSDNQTQAVLNAGFLPTLHHLLERGNPDICKEVLWCISNVTAGTIEQIELVIHHNLIGSVVKLLGSSRIEIQKESTWVISNACHGGTSRQVAHIVSQGCIPPLCQLLKHEEINVCKLLAELFCFSPFLCKFLK